MNVAARLNFGGRALEKKLAVVHDDNAVAQRHDQIHVMLDNEHDEVGRAELRKLRRQFGGFMVVEAGRGFIEKKNARLHGERTGNFEHALAAIGKAASFGIGIGLKAEETEDFHRAFAASVRTRPAIRRPKHLPPGVAHLERIRADFEILKNRHLVEKTDILIGPGNAGICNLVLLHSIEAAPVEGDGAGRNGVGAGRHIDECRLTGTIRTDDAVDKARRELSRHIIDRNVGTVLLA